MVRMVVDSVLPHAESGSNAHRKDAPPFSLFFNDPLFLLQVIQLLLRVFVEGNLLNGGQISFYLIFAEIRVPRTRSRALEQNEYQERGRPVSGPWIPCWSGSLWNNWWKPSFSSIINIKILFFVKYQRDWPKVVSNHNSGNQSKLIRYNPNFFNNMFNKFFVT